MDNSKSDMIKDIFNNIKNSDYARIERDRECRFDLALKKKDYEKLLDDMWDVYRKGNISQLPIYEKQKNYIRKYGGRIYRNSKGEHKIIIKE